jgi:hypothetical protein
MIVAQCVKLTGDTALLSAMTGRVGMVSLARGVFLGNVRSFLIVGIQPITVTLDVRLSSESVGPRVRPCRLFPAVR